MSYVETNARWPGLVRLAMHAVDAIRAVQTAYIRRRDRLQAIAELSSMQDRELNDIGISRSGIEAALYFGERDGSRRHR